MIRRDKIIEESVKKYYPSFPSTVQAEIGSKIFLCVAHYNGKLTSYKNILVLESAVDNFKLIIDIKKWDIFLNDVWLGNVRHVNIEELVSHVRNLVSQS